MRLAGFLEVIETQCAVTVKVAVVFHAKVHLKDGTSVTMSELKTGDRVQTGMTIKCWFELRHV